MVFSIYLRPESGSSSSIKFGSYDYEGLTAGIKLKTVRTTGRNTWSLHVKNIQIGDKDIAVPTSGADRRIVYLEPSSPFIYFPKADVFSVFEALGDAYKDNNIICDVTIGACYFS